MISINKHLTDPQLHIVALQGYYEIINSFHVHNMNFKFLETD
jgi:hypothetical protein